VGDFHRVIRYITITNAITALNTRIKATDIASKTDLANGDVFLSIITLEKRR
jgi:hypothetical protein